MALMTCPECGKQVSSVATNCPGCGFPISVATDSGFVKIQTPAFITGGTKPLFKKQYVSIKGNGVNWFGELGSLARFNIDGPTRVSIDLGKAANLLETTVYPNTSYKCEYTRMRFFLADYRLVEI